MIKFHCSHCSQKLGVPESYAGRRIRCNACNHHSIVPTVADSTPDPLSESNNDDLLTAEDLFASKKTGDSYHFPQSKIKNHTGMAAAKRSEVDGGLPTDNTTPHDDELRLMPQESPLPDPEAEKIRLASIGAQEKSQEILEIIEFPDDRIVENPPGYWPFAFPLRGPGLGMIGIFTVGTALVLAFWLLRFTDYFGFRLRARRGRVFPYLLVTLLGGYLCWYLNLCIQTAATGKISSPEVLYESEGDRFELVAQIARLLLSIALTLAPAIGYGIWFTMNAAAPRNASLFTDIPFWCLTAGCLFFLPMNLLSMILHDSLTGLNPILIIDSVRRTIGQYCILLVWFFALLGLAVIIPLFLHRFNLWLIIPGLAFSFYFLIVLAAVMGRFFYRNEKTLDWEV